MRFLVLLLGAMACDPEGGDGGTDDVPMEGSMATETTSSGCRRAPTTLPDSGDTGPAMETGGSGSYYYYSGGC